MKYNFGVLLGAGASIDSGISGTRAITEFVLSDSPAILTSSGNFNFNENIEINPLTADYIPKIRCIIGYLKKIIDEYYFPLRASNYEDIYYALDQLASDGDGDFDNPLIRHFSNYFQEGMAAILKRDGIIFETPDAWSDRKIQSDFGLRDPIGGIKYARMYIKDAVAHRLESDSQTCNLSPYNWIENAIGEYGPIPLFSLNHDVLLEKFLESKQLSFEDGFCAINSGSVSCWRPHSFDNTEVSVLLKLHGSINWHWTSRDGEQEHFFAKVSDYRSLPHTYNLGSGEQRIFLAGTHNKLSAYTSAPYAELRYQFLRALRPLKNMIVCGYSFGDKGVNNSLIDWMSDDAGHKLFIIDPEAESTLKRSRYAIAGKTEGWRRNNRLTIINLPMKLLKWPELIDLLQAS